MCQFLPMMGIHIKTILKQHLTLVRMSITKKSDVGNIKEDVGKEDPYLLLIQPLWFGG